jgi:hypothetical protein
MFLNPFSGLNRTAGMFLIIASKSSPHWIEIGDGGTRMYYSIECHAWLSCRPADGPRDIFSPPLDKRQLPRDDNEACKVIE